jgi:acetylornithine aminotransferase
VKTALERSNAYLLPVYARPNVILSHGEGLWVWDTEGRKYLDFSAGIAVNALGHADEGMIQVYYLHEALILAYLRYLRRSWRRRRRSSCTLQTCTTTNGPESSQSSWSR